MAVYVNTTVILSEMGIVTGVAVKNLILQDGPKYQLPKKLI